MARARLTVDDEKAIRPIAFHERLRVVAPYFLAAADASGRGLVWMGVPAADIVFVTVMGSVQERTRDIALSQAFPFPQGIDREKAANAPGIAVAEREPVLGKELF